MYTVQVFFSCTTRVEHNQIENLIIRFYTTFILSQDLTSYLTV